MRITIIILWGQPELQGILHLGHSQAEKQATHARIVDIAARRLREAGLEGVGVAELMKEAGLTVGGFYKHFGSRDDLVAEGLERAFGNWQAQLDAAEAAGAPIGFPELIARYLSTAHRDAPGQGCAVGALAGDVARSGERPRALYTAQVERYFQHVAGLLDGEDEAAKRGGAILAISAMVGALLMARAVSEADLSREILETVRDALLARSEQLSAHCA
jgi:TetR/AcrR family transcriptional repressor of nem operon